MIWCSPLFFDILCWKRLHCSSSSSCGQSWWCLCFLWWWRRCRFLIGCLQVLGFGDLPLELEGHILGRFLSLLHELLLVSWWRHNPFSHISHYHFRKLSSIHIIINKNSRGSSCGKWEIGGTPQRNRTKEAFFLNRPWSFIVNDVNKLFSECGTVEDVEVHFCINSPHFFIIRYGLFTKFAKFEAKSRKF